MPKSEKKDVILIYGSPDLIDVDTTMQRNRHSALNAIQGKSYPPLGLLYLAAVLEQEKISVGLIDLAFLTNGIPEALEMLQNSKAKIIGIYVSSFNLHLVFLLISQIRKRGVRVKVVIGGPHVHYCPDSVNYLDADFGFVSDGEYGFLQLVKELLNNTGNFSVIPNAVTKSNGRISINDISKIDNLDSLPFPSRHLWPHQKYFSPLVDGKATSAITSRGCIFRCSFCALPDRGMVRFRSIDNVIEEFQYLQKDGFSYVEFQDDFFTYNKERVKLICEGIIRKKLRLRWTCLTRVDFVDRQLLRLMKKANCTHIKYGIESGSESIRARIMNKFITNSQIKDAIRQTKREGIFTIGYFLLGTKGESLEDVRQTLRFAKEINLDYIDFNLMVMIPGSDIFKEAVKEGRIKESIWEVVSRGGEVPYSVSDKIGLSKLVYFKEKAMREHYFNPVFLYSEIFIRTRTFSSFINKCKIVFNLLNFNRRFYNYKKFQMVN